MATIRKLPGKWQTQIRRRGMAPRAKSFDQKSDAEKWARSLESELNRCDMLPDRALPSGSDGLAHSQRQPDDALAARTIAAHRAYLDALIAWKRALDAISCELWRPPDTSIEVRVRLAEQTQTE